MQHNETPKGRFTDPAARLRAARAVRLLFLLSLPLWVAFVGVVIGAMTEGDVPILLWVAGGTLVLVQIAVGVVNYGLRCENCGAPYFDRLGPTYFYGHQFLRSVPTCCEFCDYERIRKA